MRALLAERGIDLHVVYGDSLPEELPRQDQGHLSWGIHVPCHYWLDGKLCWHDVSAQVHDADLIVLPQENKQLYNYWLMLTRGSRKLALWGHGRNFQADDRGSWRERIKQALTRQADWWFAYTEISRRAMQEARVPSERITVLNNSIDLREMAALLEQATPERVEAARLAFGLAGTSHGTPVGISVASLHGDKLIPFLLDAAFRIRELLPGFQMIIVGDGSQRALVQQAVQRSGGWLHWMGVRKGLDKVLLMKMAQVMLNPGMVGLNILDALACGTPMVTTDCGLHSPEIAYLQPGINGLMTHPEVDAYARTVVQLLQDRAQLDRLTHGCLESAREYSLDNMARNFCDGISRALQA